MGAGSQEDQIADMMTQQCKIGDKLFEKYQVEEEELMAAVMKHNVMQDPEIVEFMQESFKQMDMFGGGPPGGGMPMAPGMM
jgi:hypothetical protein